MNPIEWLVINWHWAWLLFVIALVLIFGVLIIDTDWFD